MAEFRPREPSIKYIQDDANTCSLGGLYSVMYASVEYVEEHSIAACIQESLVFQTNWYADRISFSTDIMIDKERNKGD